MHINTAPLYFATENAEDGSLFGYFCGESLVSQAIYSKESAYKTLSDIKENFDLASEEVKAVEVCIDNSNLPLESTHEEDMLNRLDYLEIQVEGLFQLFDQITKDDQLEREIDNNCIGRDGAGTTGPLN